MTCGRISYAQCTDTYVNSLRKTALVLGVKRYTHADTLKNSLNDADDMANCLERLGYKVLKYADLDRRTMNKTVDDWCHSLRGYDVALFYYAGHGVEVEGKNYILPVDINPTAPTDLKHDGYNVNDIIQQMSASVKISIMFLDACRNNPFLQRTRALTPPGLARIDASLYNATFIGFATKEGRTSGDGDGRNGVFTASILKYMEIPNLPLVQIFERIASDVKKSTGQGQVPYYVSSLDAEEDICFKVVNVKTPETVEKDRSYTSNVNLLLHKIEFGSSIADVTRYEFGPAMKPISYESLPTAIECTNETIKYYWRYLKDSKMSDQIFGFLAAKGILSMVSSDSYLVYAFKDNKLIRISLRIYSPNSSFKSVFLNAIGQNTITNPDKYQVELNKTHFITGQSFEDGSFTEILLANDIGYKVCVSDWWRK